MKIFTKSGESRRFDFCNIFSVTALIFSSCIPVAAQVQLSNGSNSATLDFSSAMPASVGTNPGTAFTGAGFSPDPVIGGRLNSNAWAVTGWSDGPLAFGGTNTAGDHARGAAALAVSTGGMYAFTGAPQSAGNPCLMIQPGGSDWAPGTLTLRIENTGSSNITELDISYNLYNRNDQARSNTFNFSYSPDHVTYTPVPALDFASPAAADANGWVLVDSAPSRSTTITGLSIAPGAFYYIRWSGADNGGSGSRDEFGLDDIAITATFESACTLTDAGLTDVHCEDNNESPDTDDDYIWFQLNPTGNGLGTGYDVTVDVGSVLLNGNTPPVNVPYGASNYFRLQAGSAGAGNVTVTITDVPTGMSCTIDVLVVDPGSCSNGFNFCDAYFEYDAAISSTDLPYEILNLCESDPAQFPFNYINGGLFHATPAGLDLNPCTGEIIPASSIPGTYTLSYTIAPVWINELHYDNSGADVNEFIEVAGQAGTDLSNYQIILYNGNDGLSYQTINLTGVIDDEGSGFGAVAFPAPGLQNGAPDGMALVQCGVSVIEFLSYEGSFQALNGPAAGFFSEDILVSQEPAPASGLTLQRQGFDVCSGADFTWVGPEASSEGQLNANQSISPDCYCAQYITVVIEASPNAGSGMNIIICDNVPAIDLFDLLTGEDTGGVWVDDDNSGGLAGSMFDPAVPGPGIYHFTYTVSGINCPPDMETITVTVEGCANFSIFISDPCSCNNDATPNNQDGTFGEEVTVMGPPNLNLVVGNGSVGLIGVSIGDPIPETPLGSGIYILLFDHLDAVGYTLEVAQDDPANLLGLSVSNTCYYPIASINGLPATFCEGDPSVVLNGSAQLGGGGGPANGTGEFFVNAVGPVVQFDPATPGVFIISFVFDAADNDPDASHPGCISTVTQDVTVHDAPELSETHVDVTCPGGMDGSIDLSVAGGTPPIIFDWADVVGNNNSEDRSGLVAGMYTVTATDVNGCTDILTVTILDGVDDEDPVITCPGNITIECDESNQPANTGMATATDNCDPAPVITFSDVDDLTGCGGYTGTISRTWRAEDASGNFDECVQTIFVVDTTPPVWDQNPLPQNITVSCDMIPPAAVLSATDNCTGGVMGADVVFINEIHYDNTGSDLDEFIEIAGSAGVNLLGYSLVLYNGANGLVYGTLPLTGTIPDEGSGTGALAFFYPVNGIQNGSPDGVALVQGATVLYFLSYEGAFLAVDGPAAGMLSVDIGVAETGGEPVGQSLQLTGSGTDYPDFTWTGPLTDSPGLLNVNQNFTLPVPTEIVYTFNEVFTPGACLGEGTITRTWTATDACQNGITHTQTIVVTDDIPPVFNIIPQNLTVECNAIPPPVTVEAVDGCGPVAGIRPWINELHYDNVGTDLNEFFEIAGPAGINLSTYIVYLYNGANGLVYGIQPLSGVIPDEGNGYGALAFFLPVNGLQNGAPDGLALYDGATFIQFLSYEGAFVAADGPAAGQASVNIGVSQEPAPAIGLSLQLAGAGNQYNQFNWIGPADDSPGVLNGQQLAGPVEVPVVLTETSIPGICIGRQTIIRTYTATDDCGNSAQVTQTITVVDTTPPVAQCKNATLFLDDNGEAILTVNDINNGSSDNCSPVELALSKTLFTCLDKGTQNVILTVSDDCGNSSTCTGVVTVIDDIPPTIICPSDRTINLDPGLCCAVVSWADPTVTDNCPFVGPVTGLFTANAGAPGNFFNAFAGVTFDVQNEGLQPLTINSWAIPVTGTLGNNLIVNVYYTTVATTNVGVQTTPAAWTLLGTANVPLSVNATPWNPATLITIPVGGLTLLPGQSKGIYIVITNYPSGTLRYTNGNFTQADGTLRILSNGFAGNVNFGNTFANRAFVGRVDYQTGGEPEIIQTGGPLSGEELCKDDSPWEVSYRTEDSSGNQAECSFSISVLEYPFPISNLQCNDNVQVSLDEDCDTRIGADMILEGGPYGCYDDYFVMVFNAQNQPLPSSPFVGRLQIGGTFKVKVTDPATGNSCWGQISVEDKLPPVMICRDLNVDCGTDIPTEPAPALSGPQSIIYTGINEPIGEAGAPIPDVHEYSYDFSYLPVGTPVQDADIRIKLTGHTWLPDLDIRVISPSGIESDVFSLTGCTGAEWPIDVIFDDQGMNNLTQCAQLNAGGARLQPILAPGQSGIALDVFNGEDASGIWRIRFADNVGLDDGVIEIAGIILTVDVPAEPVTDNCDPLISLGNGLTYGDDIFNFTCAQDAATSQLILRTWTAVDDWGNSTQCTQEIRVRRPTISSVILPPNYDDLDLPAFHCSVEYPLPEITGQPEGAGCGSLQFVYEDKVLEVCQGSYTVIRTWTLHDMCTNDIAIHTQIIKVIDNTPPELVCPDIHDIEIGATKKVGYQECTAEVLMPWIQVTDDCSTTNNMTFYVWTTLPDGSILIVNAMNTQGQFVFDLPVGFDYTMTYTAIDHCGNKAECAIVVEVNDQVPPVVICETLHVVALSDSITLVHAESFDDGSYDGCTQVFFDARRGTMNSSGAFVQHPCNLPGDQLYGAQVRFYCCDALSDVPLIVDLRVRDAFGNANNCMVEVQVVDKVRPVIWCPEDITIQCGMPYEPTTTDTFLVCKQPNIPIKAAFAAVYTVPIDIFGIPADAKITDLDLKLSIDHDLVNQLQITLYSPLNRKATVLAQNGCVGHPVQYPWGIEVLFNDQAYDINIFNNTNQKVAAPFTCTSAKPSIGAYNQGQMKPQGDELKVFNGQPLNSFTSKNICLSAGQNDIDAATNRFSNFSVQQFILQAGLVPGDRILLEYSNATGLPLEGIDIGAIYLFQVINATTIEFLTITGSDITSVPSGSTHMFCASGTWLLVVEDKAPLAGGLIKEVCLSMEYALPLGLKPHVTDNAEACGLTVSHQDLATPDKCADGTFINRRWRVDDAFGNNTSCIQRVYFADASPLTVQFPCDVTIQCDKLEDLDETGEVRHNGDCELTGIEHIDLTLVTTDACYKILRTWIVKDWCQYQDDGTVDYPTTNINEQTEEITFTTAINALITSRKMDIGDRVTLRYVTSGSVEIPGLIEGDVYSLIRVSGTTFRVDYNTTKQQTVNITGQGMGPHIFRFANSDQGLPLTCDVLVEWYPFTDWYTGCCNPAASRRAWENDGDGYFKFTQEIKVVDNVAPQWVDCSDREFCSFEEACEPTFVELVYLATDNCTDSTQLSYSYFIDAFNDGSIDVSGVGNDASGAYPNGTHKIIFKVTDQCGNWNTCTSLFTIRDCKKPTPICKSIAIELMPSMGCVAAYAFNLESGESYDNCTEYEKLIFKIERLSLLDPGQTAPDDDAGDSVKVSCLDMPPNTQSPFVKLIIWVGDEAGNWDYCITELWVQDWMGPCAPTMNTELVAYVVNDEQEPVEHVAVDVTGDINIPALLTGSGGDVSFGAVPIEGQYTVTPLKDIQPLNGVSTYDLLLIQKHLLGIKSITSTYKLIAADANNSCSVSISDIIELRKMILTPGLNFKDNTSWRFVEGNYVFPNPSKPCDFPEVKNFNNLNPGMTSANFIGVKIGDVSGDAVANTLLGVDTRTHSSALIFAIADQTLEAGREYTIGIAAHHFQGVQGYQYTMDFHKDILEFVGVNAAWSDLSQSNFGYDRVHEGLLTTSWNGSGGVTLPDGELLYTVTFRALASAKLSQVLQVNSRITSAEAYDVSEELMDVQFRFDKDILVGGEFALYQNEPNPFNDVTIIGFNLPEATTATFKLFDVTGKVVKVIQSDYTKGYHSITLNRAEIQGQGMLYYQLDTPRDSATKRMLLLD